MKKAIIDILADHIVSTINNTDSSPDGLIGYVSQRAKEPDFSDISPAEKLVAVVISDSKQLQKTCGIEDWKSTIIVEVYALKNASDGIAIDSRLTLYAAEIKKELEKDHNCGGYGTDINIPDYDIVYTGENYAYVDITVEIDYRHPLGNPLIDLGA